MKTLLSAVRPLLVVGPIALILLTTPASAQDTPSAGSILQQIKPAAPPSPPSEVRLTVGRAEGNDAWSTSAPFPIKTIRIVGNTLFDTATLHALVAEEEGKSLTLAQLGERVSRITDFYHVRGYPLAQAMILAQVIEDGVLVIDVIEARYGEIALENSSRVQTSLLRSTLALLERGQPIGETKLNRSLLLLADIPGLVVGATLKPGGTVGTADLLVNTTPGPEFSGGVTVDTYGSSSTGQVRLSATANMINPLKHGDVLTVSGLTSGRGTNHGRLAYESLLNGLGTRAGASYSTLHYILSGPFASLDAHGTAQLSTFWIKTPLKRGTKSSFYGRLQYDSLDLRDHIDAGAFRSDRHLDSGTVSLTGNVQDSFLSSAVTNWSVDWRTGRVSFDDAAAQSTDAATAGTEGEFSKWNLNFTRRQSFGPKNEFFLSFSGQWGNSNLDASEKLTAGGPYAVRAYEVGAVAGDDGYLATVEVRRDLGVALNTRWQAVAFGDYAQLKINHTSWVSGENRAALGGVGVGLNCMTSKYWHASISVAARVGSVPVQVPDAPSARAWFEISRGF